MWSFLKKGELEFTKYRSFVIQTEGKVKENIYCVLNTIHKKIYSMFMKTSIHKTTNLYD